MENATPEQIEALADLLRLGAEWGEAGRSSVDRRPYVDFDYVCDAEDFAGDVERAGFVAITRGRGPMHRRVEIYLQNEM